MFSILPPRLGLSIANGWSGSSRIASDKKEVFLGEENEWLAIYAKEELQKEHFDYFIFGHRHLPLNIQLNENSRYVNIGEWLNYNSYGVFDGEELKLDYWDKEVKSKK